jgi:hypothetical protein
MPGIVLAHGAIIVGVAPAGPESKGPALNAGPSGGQFPASDWAWAAAQNPVSCGQSLVTTSSSSVLTGPWYLFFADTRYQTPKSSGKMIANGV